MNENFYRRKDVWKIKVLKEDKLVLRQNVIFSQFSNKFTLLSYIYEEEDLLWLSFYVLLLYRTFKPYFIKDENLSAFITFIRTKNIVCNVINDIPLLIYTHDKLVLTI